jgi:hypothetical protein
MRRLSLARYSGPMKGSTAAALDPLALRRMSVPRNSLSSEGSFDGAWYKDDDVRKQPTAHWCARRVAPSSASTSECLLTSCFISLVISRARRYIMHPISTSRVFWDYALRFLVLATLVVVPLRLAFVHTTNQAQTSLAILLYADVALDALCVLDVLSNFSFGYVTVNPVTARREVVNDLRRIAIRYLRHTCVLEVLSIGIPFEIAARRSFETQLLSLFKLLRVQRWLRVRARERHRAHEVGRMPRPIVVEKLTNIVMLMVVFLAWAHLTSCICEIAAHNAVLPTSHHARPGPHAHLRSATDRARRLLACRSPHRVPLPCATHLSFACLRCFCAMHRRVSRPHSDHAR